MMSDHIHEWRIWLAGSDEWDNERGDRWAECKKCDEWISEQECNRRLNATEGLSAEKARRLADWKCDPLATDAFTVLHSYADALEYGN
jgi:hypothetical protein